MDLNNLGYPTQFGQVETIKLVASPDYTEKRIGYMALSQLMNESSELLMMVTQAVKNDLNSTTSNFIVALGLTAIAEISTEDMCRELYTEVKKLMRSTSSYVKKKAILSAVRIIRNIPDTIDDFMEVIDTLINENSHSITLATMTLIEEIIKIEPERVKELRKYTKILIKILKNLIHSGYAPEYDIAGIKDPFLQVRIIRVLGFLGEGNSDASDDMNDILAEIATNTEGTRNTANSILYECVRTIMMIEASSGLRVLGINILGRFLVNKENNIRFIALKSLHQVVAIDYNAVQRHKTTILNCLKDPDLVIKKKGLDLIYQICKNTNVKSIVKELLNFLLTAEKEFKEELANKTCMAVEKYSPTKKWHVDTVIKVLTLAGSEIMDNFICSLITLIASTSELQNYAVNKTYFSMKENMDQAGLQQLGVWLIGEFGEMLVSGQTMDIDDTPINVSEAEAVETIAKVMEHYKNRDDKGDVIIQYSLIALSKLTVRFEAMKPEIRELIESCVHNQNIEIQQRACEFLKLFDQSWDQHRVGIFEPMPFQGDENMLVDATERAIKEEGEGDDGDDLMKVDTAEAEFTAPRPQTQQPIEDDPLGDIFGNGNNDANDTPTDNYDPLGDIFGSGNGESTGQNPSSESNALDDIFGGGSSGNTGGDDMGDIFGGSGGNDMFGAQPTSSSPAYTAYEDGNIVVNLKFERDSSDKSSHKITAEYVNKSSSKLDSINMQVSVKKYLKLQLFAVSNPSLDPNSPPVTQQMSITNSQEGQNPIVLKARITYTHVDSGNKVVETKLLDKLPSNY
jgi:AP-1 complex subunit gamma-1